MGTTNWKDLGSQFMAASTASQGNSSGSKCSRLITTQRSSVAITLKQLRSSEDAQESYEEMLAQKMWMSREFRSILWGMVAMAVAPRTSRAKVHLTKELNVSGDNWGSNVLSTGSSYSPPLRIQGILREISLIKVCASSASWGNYRWALSTIVAIPFIWHTAQKQSWNKYIHNF